MKNEDIYRKIKSNFDALSKPLDGLGEFEEIIARMGAVLSDERADIKRAALAVFISDNGIIKEGVSQSDETVTLSVAKMLGAHRTSVCFMADEAGVDVYPYNIGIRFNEAIEGVDASHFVMPGTADFLLKEAMAEKDMLSGLKAGEQVAKEIYDKGYRVLLLGEMGIGNTTTSAAVISALLGKSPKDICGRGAGLSDAGLIRKVQVIEQAIRQYELTPESDPLRVLQSVGGVDIAAMTGAITKAYELNMPVILDGLITAAAALISVRMDEKYRDILFFSHRGREKGIMDVARALNMEPMLAGGMALGEGTGAVMYYGLLKTAKAVYDANATFAESGVESYHRFT